MKKRLTRNLSLKIVSVLAAILIWLFASSASDPVIRAEYDVKVEVANDDYITDSGKTYQIEDADREVKVYVNGAIGRAILWQLPICIRLWKWTRMQMWCMFPWR